LLHDDEESFRLFPQKLDFGIRDIFDSRITSECELNLSNR